MTWRTGTGVLALALLAICARPMVARACTQDDECDNGDVCTIADTCVLGTCLLGGIGDLDANLVCDGEFNAGKGLSVTRLVLRKGTTTVGNLSSVLGSGDFVRDPLDGELLDAPISVRVKDALAGIGPSGDGVDVAFTWQPSQCRTSGIGLIRCESENHLNFIRLKPNRLFPEQITFSFRVKGVAVAPGPFFGPVRTVLTHNATVHRTDLIEDCKFVTFGVLCREF
jgi:hypothetical protein